VSKAERLLREVLERGPVPVEQVKRRALSEGITLRQLGRARERMGLGGFSRNGIRYWTLPYVRKADRPKPQPEQMSFLADVEEEVVW
jgi:hypothetical protein